MQKHIKIISDVFDGFIAEWADIHYYVKITHHHMKQSG